MFFSPTIKVRFLVQSNCIISQRKFSLTTIKKYPFISLTIKDFRPKVAFHPDENMVRVLTVEDTDLASIVFDIARKLELLSANQVISQSERDFQMNWLLGLAREADTETFKLPSLKFDIDEAEFQIDKVINNYLEEILSEKNPYADVSDLAEEVEEEINRNHNMDILANVLDAIYQILIAKTILNAASLGIGDIYLDDEHKNARLRELMARELERVGVDLVIAE